MRMMRVSFRLAGPARATRTLSQPRASAYPRTPLSAGRSRGARCAAGVSHLPHRQTLRGAKLDLGRCSRAFSTNRETRSSEIPSFAFAFDIDGVLLHVSKPIPGASETLTFLNEHNIPFILLTNGGGKHETDRVRDLSEKLGVPLTTDNFVQSHTPFQELVDGPDGLRDKTVLVTGADAELCRSIAARYGFRSVVTPADILAAEPTIWPFDPLMESVYASTARPLPRPLYRPNTSSSLSSSLKIDAILVFNDPRDWAVDIQLITDLLLSHRGHLGTYSPRNGDACLPGAGWQGDGQPALYFSNADLFWSTGYHLPRFGQGAFQAAVAGVWSRVTAGRAELVRRSFGKPCAETYRFAERVLGGHRRDLLLRGKGGPTVSHDALAPVRAVYMVGDNPESDIAGANAYESEVGAEWKSALVRTGVWDPHRGGEEALAGRFRPDVVVDDVKGAVRWALEREGWKGVF